MQQKYKPYKGKKLNSDVFVYYLEAACAGEEAVFLKGNITLVR